MNEYKRYRQLTIGWSLALILLAGLLSPAEGMAALPRSAEIPPLLNVLRDLRSPNFCGETFSLNDPEIRERFELELLLNLWDRAQILLWVKRSGRVFPPIERILAQAGLPDDLKYVAVAESALRPHASSGKKAVGYWQFMAATGRKYGLTVNSRRDERRNLTFSTRAAAKYFRELHGMFGYWSLAAAAYNMGEKGLMKRVKSQKIKDYHRLYLNTETHRFVFRILAIKTIFENLAKFGFHLQEDDYYREIETDRVLVSSSGETHLQLVAEAARSDLKKIKDLNPELRGSYLARGNHPIQVPRGGAKGFKARYARVTKAHRNANPEKVYIVKRGDSLSAIAQKLNVSVTSILLWNRLNPAKPIYPGQKLVIHPRKGSG